MEGIFLLVLIVAVVAYIAYARFNTWQTSKAAKRAIQPDFATGDIAINSTTGEIWLGDFPHCRVLQKDQILAISHEWMNINKRASVSSHDHHFVFTINDLKAPRSVIYFRNEREAKEWEARLDVFRRR